MTPGSGNTHDDTVKRALIIAAILGFAILLATFTGKPREGNIETGISAPDFTLTALDGMPVALSDHQGKGVMLFFWGTWCGICVEEMPMITKLADEYISSEFSLISVAVDDRPADLRQMLQHLEKQGISISFPILLDPERKVNRAYKVRGVPYIVFINRDGKIAQSYVGEVGESYLRDTIESL